MNSNIFIVATKVLKEPTCSLSKIIFIFFIKWNQKCLFGLHDWDYILDLGGGGGGGGPNFFG
jgi:hypothetical protein